CVGGGAGFGRLVRRRTGDVGAMGLLRGEQLLDGAAQVRIIGAGRVEEGGALGGGFGLGGEEDVLFGHGLPVCSVSGCLWGSNLPLSLTGAPGRLATKLGRWLLGNESGQG